MGRKKTEGIENLRDIHIRGAILNFLGNSLLMDADIHMSWGRRYGLVGKNGCGKSILLKNIANREFDGIPRNLMIILCESEVDATDEIALEKVLKADIERDALLTM
jgi:ATPase subunit of ABC transporter with duplicated ATPase domains